MVLVPVSWSAKIYCAAVFALGNGKFSWLREVAHPYTPSNFVPVWKYIWTRSPVLVFALGYIFLLGNFNSFLPLSVSSNISQDACSPNSTWGLGLICYVHIFIKEIIRQWGWNSQNLKKILRKSQSIISKVQLLCLSNIYITSLLHSQMLKMEFKFSYTGVYSSKVEKVVRKSRVHFQVKLRKKRPKQKGAVLQKTYNAVAQHCMPFILYLEPGQPWGGREDKRPRTLKSKGPNNTQCFNFWGEGS